MKLAGFMSNSPAAQRVAADEHSEKAQLKIPAYVVFTPDTVELDFIGSQHEPVLHVEGTVEGLTPATQMPYDIEKVTFNADNGQRFVGDYRFNNEQLVRLIGKGLYIEGFEPPREFMKSLSWELPMDVDVTVVAPDSQDAPPIVLVDMQGIHDATFSMDTSGYELSEYFDDHVQKLNEGVSVDGRDVEHRGVSREEMAAQSLFGDSDFEDKGNSQSRRIEQERALTAAQLMAKLAGIDLKAEPALAKLSKLIEAEEYLGTDLSDTAGMSEWEREVTLFYNDKIREHGEVGVDAIDLDMDDEVDFDTALDMDEDIDFSEGESVETEMVDPEPEFEAMDLDLDVVTGDERVERKDAAQRRQESRRVADRIQKNESVKEAYAAQLRRTPGLDPDDVERAVTDHVLDL